MSTAGATELAKLSLTGETPGAELFRARRHLVDTRDLTVAEIDCLMAVAGVCKYLYGMTSKPLPVLEDMIVANLFYESSTRTRSSFELAARKLGVSVLNLDIASSSVSKGETIGDTAQTLMSMGVHAVVQRHSSSGSAYQLAQALGDRVHVINAGDGWNAHPTQALLDLFSMLECKPDLRGSKVAIIGDITHSRVARSNIWLLKLLGVDIHVAGPPTLVPPDLVSFGVTVHNRLEPAIENCDFVMALRLQLERQKQGLIPSTGEYKRLYRLDHHRIRLAKPTVRVLHPGPVNRDVEITGELADDPALSLMSRQVYNGIAVRMAVLYLLMSEGGAAK
ncbi:MAG TPA: aspartate carbamoyltransferase catalytic subunit [Candidatus Obscuribacterales bacterium]